MQRASEVIDLMDGICSTPSHEITLGQIILKIHDMQNVHASDSINPQKNYIYPGYAKSTIASGKKLKMTSTNASYSCDDIVYVQNDDDIVTFDDFNSAKADYIRWSAKDIFKDLLQRSVLNKKHIGRAPKHSSNIESINQFVWDNYIKGLYIHLHAKNNSIMMIHKI